MWGVKKETIITLNPIVQKAMSDETDEIKIKPIVTFSVSGKKLTHRQLEALAMVQSLSSQTRASHELGIATPVLHRHIKKAEEKLGRHLVETTATGTRLTALGEKIVDEFGRYRARVKKHEKFTIGCTPVTMDAVLEAVSDVEDKEALFEIYIGDDHLNERLLRLGELDVIIFDDPVNVYMHEDRGRYFELFMDTMLHCRRGNKYAKYRYGAQRLGFRHLEIMGESHKIVKWISDLESLIRSDLSFFLNRSLAGTLLNNKILDLEEVPELNHAIMILVLQDDDKIEMLIDRLRAGYKENGMLLS